MPTLAQLNLQINTNAQQVTQNFVTLASAGQTLQSTLLKLIGVGSAMAAVFKAVGEATTLERVEAGFVTLEKSASAANATIAQLKAFSQGTGFELKGVETAAKQLLSFGVAADQILPILRLAGDVARTQGGGTEQVEQIARTMSFLLGDAEKVQRALIQLRLAGIDAIKYVSDAINTTPEAALQKLQKGMLDSQTVFKAVTDGIRRDFGGGIARDLQTLGGQWDRFKENLSNTVRTITDSAIATLHLTDGLKSLASALQPGSAGFTALATAAKVLLLVFEAFVGLEIASVFLSMVTHAGGLITAFRNLTILTFPLLTAFLVVGTALASWSIGQTLFDQFKRVRQEAAGLALLITHPTDALQVLKDEYNKLAPTRLPNDQIGLSAPGSQQMELLQRGSPRDIYYRQILQTYAEPDNISGKGIGADLAKNFDKAVDYATSLTQKLLSAQTVTEAIDKAQQQMNAAAEKTNGIKQTTIDVLIEEVQQQTKNLALTKTQYEIEQQVHKASEAADIQKLKNTDPAAFEQQLTRLRAALNDAATAKAQQSIEKGLEQIEQEKDLIGLYGDEYDVQKQLQGLTGQALRDGVQLTQGYIEKVKARLTADQQVLDLAKRIRAASDQIGQSFGQAFDDAILSAKKFSDVLLELLKSIQKAVLDAFVTIPLQKAVGGFANTFLTAVSGAAGGGAGASDAGAGFGGGGSAGAFAYGGVVDSPTFFNYGGGRAGVMGEAGPEGVLPLKRGRDGKLGVAAAGGGVTVVQNIQTPNADSFRKSQRQLAMDARRAAGLR